VSLVRSTEPAPPRTPSVADRSLWSLLHRSGATRHFGKAWLGVGYLFPYIPIFALIFYSFNASPLPVVWAGASLRWYREIAHDRDLMASVWLSLRIAFWAASASVVLGALAGFALVKYKRFVGRTLFAGMVNAPLVMPEVIIGLSLLLLLVASQQWFGVPERGMFTIWLGHVMLGMSYATVVIQARLQDLNPSLEEAAADLGARPIQVFVLVTLPLIVNALVSAFLLTFTLSLDDVVLAAFLSGPGATTLPLVIFSRAHLGMRPDINAVASVIIGVVSVVVVGGSWLVVRAERRRAAEIAAAQRA
jgi:putrescine transport system permease protein